MSEYVYVIDKGCCYSHICDDSTKTTLYQCESSWFSGELPIENRQYKVICENEHPFFIEKTITTIEDEDTGQRYVMGVDGLSSIANTENTNIKDMIIPSPMPQGRQADNYEEIKVGDLVIVTKNNDSHHGELFKVTNLNSFGYPYVLGNVNNSTPLYGYTRSDIAKYKITPDIPEDQVPLFSKNELIEIMDQDKSSEEILLDLKDHITN